MKKSIAIIGSTGSIGTQALKVIDEQGHRVAALAAGSNAALLLEQAKKYRPAIVAIDDAQAAAFLRQQLEGSETLVACGSDGVCAAAAAPRADITLNAAVGIAGLRPTLAAIKAKKTLALANKESLVCAGELVMEAARANGVKIIPVDSEHSAIFQCMQAGQRGEVERVIITASGGPFFGKSADEIYGATASQALKHPNWQMGRRITIDSATMMNKGFEMIEAMHLFGLAPRQIEAVVHRESIVHSLVEFCDGAVIAQLSPPDMGLAIQYAIGWPARGASKRQRLDLAQVGGLTFFRPDDSVFPALGLCRRVMEQGGSLGAALNGADEAAVEAFLEGRITFGQIYPAVKAALETVPLVPNPTIEQIFQADAMARSNVRRLISREEAPQAGGLTHIKE